jgi:tetratricopeptide (TPR) repeat protein
LTLYPFQATIHLRYATFLRYIRNDLVSSEKYYKLATEIQPNAETLGNYASFLHSNGNIDQAESLYQTSIELDNCHVNNYCNYGLLLSEERKRYEAAEDCYK